MSKEIGERVLWVRTQNGLSQRDFAARLGISSGGISQIESGKTMPGGEFLLRIHEEFGVDVTWLLTGQYGGKKPPPAPPKYTPPPDEEDLLNAYRTSTAEVKAVIRAASLAAAKAARGSVPASIRRKTS